MGVHRNYFAQTYLLSIDFYAFIVQKVKFIAGKTLNTTENVLSENTIQRLQTNPVLNAAMYMNLYFTNVS